MLFTFRVDTYKCRGDGDPSSDETEALDNNWEQQLTTDNKIYQTGTSFVILVRTVLCCMRWCRDYLIAIQAFLRTVDNHQVDPTPCASAHVIALMVGSDAYLYPAIIETVWRAMVNQHYASALFTSNTARGNCSDSVHVGCGVNRTSELDASQGDPKPNEKQWMRSRLVTGHFSSINTGD